MGRQAKLTGVRMKASTESNCTLYILLCNWPVCIISAAREMKLATRISLPVQYSC